MFRLIVSVLVLATSVLGDPKLICYWNAGNGGAGNIDVQACTHVNYAFVTIDPNSLLIGWRAGTDVQNILGQLKALKTKNPNIKLIAALGGGGDGGDGKYGRMVTNADNRAKFVASVVKFLNQNAFDGLDFDWEYPACPQTVCDDAHKAEKPGFAAVLKELRTGLDNTGRKYELSVAVNAGAWLTDNAYDYPTMASALDHINVMTYDNAGSWSKATGHHSGFEWCKQGVQMWASKGIPKSKINMGVPFYGVSFKLANPNQHGLNASITGGGDAIIYDNICLDVKKQGWTKERSADGPIAYQGTNWVGYDDPTSAAQKGKWVKDNGFGGIIVWEINQDDMQPNCCKQAKPLINGVSYGLFGKGAAPSTYGCE